MSLGCEWNPDFENISYFEEMFSLCYLSTHNAIFTRIHKPQIKKIGKN